tara:strand:+ start:2114 stop:2572 length:459 start_codon:yes stop_codon:yes gene_type:complete
MSNDIFLNITIYPHRSLSKNGFAILMTIIIILCSAGGIIFWYLGAWPVFGFFGLDIILIYLAFKINYRSGKIYERLLIASKKLMISRCFPSGKIQTWDLDPRLAYVELVKINNNSQLLIKSNEKVVSVGSFLNLFDKEKLEKRINEGLKNLK